MVNIKSKIDIDGIKKAGEIVNKVLNELSAMTKPGIKTIEYDIIAEKEALSLNAIPAFKGYNGFPYSVCVSVNEEVVHGFPSQRKLREGDIVSLDYGIYYNGYYAFYIYFAFKVDHFTGLDMRNYFVFYLFRRFFAVNPDYFA